MLRVAEACCKGLLDKLLASSAPRDAEVIAATFWEVDDMLPDSMRRVRSLSITPATFFHARALELSTQTVGHGAIRRDKTHLHTKWVAGYHHRDPRCQFR